MTIMSLPAPAVQPRRACASPARLATLLSCYDFPVARDLEPAAIFLIGAGYTPVMLDAILAHLARHKTAECFPFDDPADRAAVEALLPMDPAWQDSRWDAEVWSLA